MDSKRDYLASFERKGWLKFGFDPEVKRWADRARSVGLALVQDPMHAHWLQCQGTWFVGVDVLPNDASGAIDGIGFGDGLAQNLHALFGDMPALHRAQVSVIYPGYPRPRNGESDAAFGYRLRRDAAHVDGLRPVPETGGRVCAEYHQFVLGLPLTQASKAASPMVVWEGSHKVMGAALREALAHIDVNDRATLDISAAYKAARREVFATCARREIHAEPGDAYVLHRHALHGVAPWGDGAQSESEGRAIAYFRPETALGLTEWLSS